MAILVSNPIKATFIHTPKAGGNSIAHWLLDNTTAASTKRKQHATIKQIKAGNHTLGPQDDLGWTFCVVRNPWDFCVSWYTFKIMLAEYYIDQVNKDPSLNNGISKRYNVQNQKIHLETLQQGFDVWLKNQKFNNQIRWADGVDYVMKLENITEDFKVVQEKMNCYKPLGHLNKTTGRTKYKDYYTSQELVDIVAEHFKMDIETFGYDF
jgi:hypothetical protein